MGTRRLEFNSRLPIRRVTRGRNPGSEQKCRKQTRQPLPRRLREDRHHLTAWDLHICCIMIFGKTCGCHKIKLSNTAQNKVTE